MTTIFLVSDTHFGHNNMYTFKNTDGSLVRPWAANADDGDEIMIAAWNKIVGPNDKVYHLGDVAIPRRGIKQLARLNGEKVLIKGNHDIFKLNEYLPYFKDIRGSHKLDQFILTHIPIHDESLARWSKGNIHGHLHSNRVLDKSGNIDPRYINVGIEHLPNFAPISFDEVLKMS